MKEESTIGRKVLKDHLLLKGTRQKGGEMQMEGGVEVVAEIMGMGLVGDRFRRYHGNHKFDVRIMYTF